MTKPKMISRRERRKKREENQKEDLVTVQKNIEDSAKSGAHHEVRQRHRSDENT